LLYKYLYKKLSQSDNPCSSYSRKRSGCFWDSVYIANVCRKTSF